MAHIFISLEQKEVRLEKMEICISLAVRDETVPIKDVRTSLWVNLNSHKRKPHGLTASTEQT